MKLQTPALRLTAAAYAPFGEIVAARPSGARSGNQGRARIWDRVARLENERPEARPNLAVFRTGPWDGDSVTVRILERHPRSTQVFVPMTAARYLVIVAPPGADPDLAAMRAFLVEGDTGVTYRPGVWHHPLIALDREADFASLTWEGGDEEDCELRLVDGGVVSWPIAVAVGAGHR
jgi:ureidoglycolate lyase